MSENNREAFGFTITHQGEGLARTGIIKTPHGEIATPAFIPVGTKATVKAVLPETMKDLGSQALLANAYHLYLQPGPDVVDAAGGLGAFMNWPGPTFTDSGGFQVLSRGVGFKKVLAMDTSMVHRDDVIAENKERLAHVDDLARAIPIQTPRVGRMPRSPCTRCRSGAHHTDLTIAVSAHDACPIATCVANTLTFSAPLASSQVYQCVRGQSPTRGDRPRLPSGI